MLAPRALCAVVLPLCGSRHLAGAAIAQAGSHPSQTFSPQMADAVPVEDDAKAARRREIERNVAAAREKQAQAERAAKAALDKPERGARTLTKQQVVEKLDNVPVFTIVEEASGALVGVTDESGETCCRWYADVDEAQSALVLTQHLNPDLPLSLGVTPLGTAFALTSGWKATSSAHPLKLQASKAIVAAVAKELGASPDGAFPLFGCDELRSPRLLPLFLSKEDLHATWRAMGRSAEAMPTELQVSSLHTIGPSACKRRTDSLSACSRGASTHHVLLRCPASAQDAHRRQHGLEHADARRVRKCHCSCAQDPDKAQEAGGSRRRATAAGMSVPRFRPWERHACAARAV